MLLCDCLKSAGQSWMICCMSLWVSTTVANKLYTLGETVCFYSTTTPQTHLLHDTRLFTYKMPQRNEITSWISKPLYFHHLIFHSSSHKRMYVWVYIMGYGLAALVHHNGIQQPRSMASIIPHFNTHQTCMLACSHANRHFKCLPSWVSGNQEEVAWSKGRAAITHNTRKSKHTH